MTKPPELEDILTLLKAVPIRPENLPKREIVIREIQRLAKDRDEWRHEHDMYARAWLRELGGKLFNKSHRIDSHVKTTKHVYEGYRRALKAGLIGETYYEDDRCTHTMQHQLYTNADHPLPRAIVDDNGAVVLGLCKVCNRGEIELQYDDGICPGPKSLPPPALRIDGSPGEGDDCA